MPSFIIRILWCLMLAGFFGYSVSTLETTAPTFDEVAHLPAGFAHWQTGKVVYNPEHPPLAKLLAALPLLPVLDSLDLAVPEWRDLDEWRFGRRLLFQQPVPPWELMTRARIPMILLGVLLCAVATLWAFRWKGNAGATLTLLLCAGSPLLIAHTRLVTTDVPLACFALLSAYLSWRIQSHPTLPRALGLGLALGAMLAVKFSALLFLPPLGLAVSWSLWRRASSEPELEVSASGSFLAHLQRLTLVVGGMILVPLLSFGWPLEPMAYFRGLAQVGFNHSPGYAFYLMGKLSEQGFPAYFPLAWILKESPATLLVLALAPVVWVVGWLRRPSEVESTPVGSGASTLVPGLRSRMQPVMPSPLPFLVLPALAYALFVMARAPQVGVRYLIPCLPFVYVGCAWVGASLWTRPIPRVLWFLPWLLQVLALGRAWPDPISYFNGLLGCQAENAIHCLDDSNLDWGQDFARAADAVRSLRDDEEVRLLYFGTAHPSAYLRNWRRMEADELLLPEPRIYLVSIHLLNRLILERGEAAGMNWLTRFKPLTKIGHTYLIYDFRRMSAKN